MMLSSEVLAQGLGILAFCFSVGAFASKGDKRFRLFLTTSCVLLAVHYGLLMAYVAAVNLIINAVRAVLSVNHHGMRWFWLFFIGQSLISLTVYQSPIDLLPWLASAISCYALFNLQGIALRVGMMLCTFVWLLNSALVGSIGGVMNDVFNISVSLLTIYRLHRDQLRAAKTV